MQHQPTFFGPGNVATVQGELFAGLADESDLTCELCGSAMVFTESYLCCPRGCGRLHLAHVEDDGPESGLWFEGE